MPQTLKTSLFPGITMREMLLPKREAAAAGQTQYQYHEGITQIKREKDSVFRSKGAKPLSDKKFYKFRGEIKKIRGTIKKEVNVSGGVSGLSSLCKLF